MDILVDANIIISFIDCEGYARRFFAQAMSKQHILHFLPDVYDESVRVTNDPGAIKRLFSEMVKYEIYTRVYLTEDEDCAASALSGRCLSLFGHNLSRTDRRLAAVAKNRGICLFTMDKELKELARSEGVRLYRHVA